MESLSSLGGSDRRRSRKGRWFLVLLILGLLGWGAVATFRVGPAPTVELSTSHPSIGRQTRLDVQVDEPTRGVARLLVEVVDSGQARTLYEDSYAVPPAWAPWRSPEPVPALDLPVDWEALGTKSAEVALRVSAWPAGTWLESPEPVRRELTLPVRRRPPGLQVLSGLNYAAQGGTGVVVYRVTDSSVEDGVRVGEWSFPGHPLQSGRPGRRFALFAVPFDLEDTSQIRLIARDDADNIAETAFVERLFRKPYETDTIRVDDDFLARVVPAILSRTPDLDDRGDLLQNYLAINGELRRLNNEELTALAAESPDDFLWSEPFLSMPGAAVMSSFADRRTYLYEGQEVDHQDHLGFDLASVQRAPVPAANDGIVALARFLGIYGNTVVVDHGYGLMSLYGHLSSLEVEEGSRVARGDVIGRTGLTGLAGGDHLHFSMLLEGRPVTPVEWWDGKWIQDRLMGKLEDGGGAP